MKKLIALLLALAMVIGMAACSRKEPEAAAPAATEAAPAATEAASASLTQQEAAEQRDAGTLVSDPLSGYEYSELNDTWYYSNYPNYKDFKEDGQVKVGFICKFAGAWFTPKSDSLKETVEAAGYSYQFFNCDGDTQAFLDNVQNAINQGFDFLVLTPPNTTLLAEAIAMLHDTGIAYMTTDDPGPDNFGFYAPHVGLYDYYLHYELAKACGAHLIESGWVDDIADDWSNFRLVVMDAPGVEAIQRRTEGFRDGIVEVLGIPEDAIVVNDTNGGMDKFSALLQSGQGTVEKWIIDNGGGGVEACIPMAQELDMDMNNIIWTDCFSTDLCMILMMEDPILRQTCWGVGLASAPSGVQMGEIIIDLVENGTPLPAFAPYALNVVNGETVDEFHAAIYGG